MFRISRKGYMYLALDALLFLELLRGACVMAPTLIPAVVRFVCTLWDARKTLQGK